MADGDTTVQSTVLRGRRVLALGVCLLLAAASCNDGSPPTDTSPVYSLSTNVSPDGAGQVSPEGGEYDEGESVELTATAEGHYRFSEWGGDADGNDNPLVVTIDSDTEITALFDKRSYPLSIDIDGEGTVDEQIIQQRTTDYEAGTVVELTASPATGWRFIRWQGDLESDENPTEITIEEEMAVTAVFERRDYPLSITIEGSGSVSEELVQAKTTDYEFGSVVKLEATPSSGWSFLGWGGDLEGDENPSTITIDGPREVTAIFTEDDDGESNGDDDGGDGEDDGGTNGDDGDDGDDDGTDDDGSNGDDDGGDDDGTGGDDGNGGDDNGSDENTATSFSADYNDFVQGEEGTLSFTVQDPDTLESIAFTETRPGGEKNEFSVTPNTTEWDTTIARTYDTTGDAVWDLTVTDKHPEQETTQETYIVNVQEQTNGGNNGGGNGDDDNGNGDDDNGTDENTATSFSADYNDFVQGEEGTLSFTVQDPDTLESIAFTETTPGGEKNEFRVTPNTTDWDTTITRTYDAAGDVTWALAATDKHPEQETKEQTYTVNVQEAPKNTPTDINANYSTFAEGKENNIEFTIKDPDTIQEIAFTETTPSGQKNEFSVTPHVTDWDTTIARTYDTAGDAKWTLAVTDKHFEPETQEETYTINVDAIHQLTGRTTNQLTEENIHEALAQLQQNNKDITSDQTNDQGIYELHVQQPAGTEQTYTLHLTKQGYQPHEQTVKLQNDTTLDDILLKPENINFTGTMNAQTTEDDSTYLSLDALRDIIDFKTADEDTINIQTLEDQLRINPDGQGYWLVPEKDFSGQLTYTIHARNNTARENNQEETLYVEALPRATIIVGSNEENQPLQHMNVPDALQAHIGVYNEEGELTDTLSNTTGEFNDVKLRTENTTKIRTRLTRGEETFSYLRTENLQHNGQNITQHNSWVVDFYLRDKNKQVTGELTHGEPGVASPEGFRKWATGMHQGGVSRWKGDDVPGTEPGTFNWYTKGTNGRGPDELILPEIYHIIGADGSEQTNYLTDKVKDIMLDVYQNDIKPWLGDYAREPQIVDSLAFDYGDRDVYPNIALLTPNSHPDPGELGRIIVLGEEPNNIYIAEARIRSVEIGSGSDEQLTTATSQETTAGFGFMTRAPADSWAEEDQSVVHNSTTITRPSLYDGKMMRTVWEPTYTTRLEDVYGKPNY